MASHTIHIHLDPDDKIEMGESNPGDFQFRWVNLGDDVGVFCSDVAVARETARAFQALAEAMEVKP